MPDIELKRENGGIFKTPSEKPDKPYLFIFYSPECPVSLAYKERFSDLFEKYREDDLRIFLVNITAEEPLAKDDISREVKEVKKGDADERNFLLDLDRQAVRKFGLDIVPQAYLFGFNMRLVYKGAIDDEWQSENIVTRVYLEDALENTLDNLDVDFEEIAPVGTKVEELLTSSRAE